MDATAEEEGAREGVAKSDGCPDEEPLGDSNGVKLAAPEADSYMLGDAVTLSVDELDGLIGGVFVTVSRADGDTVGGSV